MEYVLDVVKWRCASEGPNKLGLGPTYMCNQEGYMCCLGQFSTQKGIVYDGELVSRLVAEPDDLKELYDDAFVENDGVSYRNTYLACDLMNINDSTSSTPKEKIEAIRKKLEEHGHSLTVLNEDILDV